MGAGGGAQQRHDEGADNVEFVECDAQVHDFEAGAFDIVVSRFGTMFFEDPDAAYDKVLWSRHERPRVAGEGASVNVRLVV